MEEEDTHHVVQFLDSMGTYVNNQKLCLQEFSKFKTWYVNLK